MTGPVFAQPGSTGELQATSEGSSRERIQWRRELPEALELAKLERKPLLLFFTSARSPWSRAMQENVLQQPEILEILPGFILVSLDESQVGDWESRYSVRDFPVILLCDPSGEEQKRIFGYLDSLRLKQALQGFLHLDAVEPVLDGSPPDSATLLFQQLLESRKAGRLKVARDLATQLVEEDPGNAQGYSDNALAFLGLLETRRGQWSRALALYERLFKLYPETELKAHLLFSLAYAAAQAGEVERSRTTYLALLKDFPEHPDRSFVQSEVQRLTRLQARQLR